jgi:hypothetical protein
MTLPAALYELAQRRRVITKRVGGTFAMQLGALCAPTGTPPRPAPPIPTGTPPAPTGALSHHNV